MLEWLMTLGVSLLLPLLGFFALITCMLLRWWRAAAVVCALGVGFVLFAYAPHMYKPLPIADDVTRLVFLNVRIAGPDIEKQAAALKAQAADVIALVEVRKDWLALLEERALGDYPYHVLHKFGWRAGRIVYDDHALIVSRWPLVFVGGETGEGERLALYRVDAPRPFHVFVVHPMAPLTPNMDTIRKDYLKMLARTPLPADTVVVGDFNAVAWDPALWPLWQRDDLTMHMNWLPTYHSALPAIGIDHVMTGPRIELEALQRWSDRQSDHFGVVVDFGVR